MGDFFVYLFVFVLFGALILSCFTGRPDDNDRGC